jgi:hypothetical protein
MKIVNTFLVWPIHISTYRNDRKNGTCYSEFQQLHFVVLKKRANAKLVRPHPRPDRQYTADTTPKPLWRAIISKLRRAGAVITKLLLAILYL